MNTVEIFTARLLKKPTITNARLRKKANESKRVNKGKPLFQPSVQALRFNEIIELFDTSPINSRQCS
jgi:hypothetical protein